MHVLLVDESFLVQAFVHEPPLKVHVKGRVVGDVSWQALHRVLHVDGYVDHLALDAALVAAVRQTPDAHKAQARSDQAFFYRVELGQVIWFGRVTVAIRHTHRGDFAHHQRVFASRAHPVLTLIFYYFTGGGKLPL